MADRIEPHRAWSNEVQISDEEWESLERASKRRLPSSVRQDIKSLINEYYADYCFSVYSTPPGPVIAKLNSIRSAARKLSGILGRYDIFETKDPRAGDDLRQRLEKANPECDEDSLEHDIDVHIKNSVITSEMEVKNAAIARVIQKSIAEIYDRRPETFVTDVRSMLGQLIDSVDDALGEIEVGKGSCGDRRTTQFLIGLHKIFADVPHGASKNRHPQAISKDFRECAAAVFFLIKKQSVADFGRSSVTFRKVDSEAIRKRLEAHRRQKKEKF